MVKMCPTCRLAYPDNGACPKCGNKEFIATVHKAATASSSPITMAGKISPMRQDVRIRELEESAKRHQFNPVETKIYIALFTERFPNEPMDSHYMNEWEDRIKRLDHGLSIADSETTAVIQKAMQSLPVEKETEKSWGYSLLKNQPKGTVLYTVLRHVSTSGMMRRIDAYLIKNNEPIKIVVPELGRTSNKPDDGYFEATGAGMDMGYDLVYKLGSKIHGDGYYFTHHWM